MSERTTVLTGVDAARAQTWNWLGINETTLEVPTDAGAAGSGAAGAAGATGEPPAWAADVRLIAGAEAQGWLDELTSEPVSGVSCTEEPHEILAFLGDVAGEPLDVSAASLLCEPGTEGAVTVVAAGEAATTANTCRLVLEAGATATADILVARPKDAIHVQSFGATLAEDASLTLRVWILGAAKTTLAVACDLEGARSSFASELRYLAEGEECVDITYDVRQLGRDTKAAIGASGVLTDRAAKTLRASIDLVRGCKGSVGSESETVLVAGEGVRNKTLPVILCSEDDVQGDHGATIGSLSPEQMGFLSSRGLSEEDVVALAGQAIVDDAASALGNDALAEIVGWTRAARGPEAAAQAADAGALIHGTLCDEASKED